MVAILDVPHNFEGGPIKTILHQIWFSSFWKDLNFIFYQNKPTLQNRYS
jgi:hypothetical protein